MNILNIGTGKPDTSAKWWNTSTRTEFLQSEGHSIDTISYFDPSKHPGSANSKHKMMTEVELVRSSVYLTPLRHFKEALCRREKYDLIYGNNYLATTAALTEKIYDTPIIFHVHGDIFQEYLLNKAHNNIDSNSNLRLPDIKVYLNKILGSINYRTADHIACVSRSMVEYISKRYHISNNRISYVPNYTNIEYFKPGMANQPTDIPDYQNPSLLKFGYIGGFQAWQGVENLLAAAELIDSNDANFIFVGLGGESTENIGRIGRVNRKSVREYYEYCDVLILPRPSHIATEIAAPTKFAEYTAMGKPILSTNVGDAAELIKEYDCGIVVEDNSVESLLTGINKFINIDDEKISSLGENARKLAKNEFSLRKKGHLLTDMVEQFE